MKVLLGVDVGGTEIKMIAARAGAPGSVPGEALAEWRCPTPDSVNGLTALIRGLTWPRDVKAGSGVRAGQAVRPDAIGITAPGVTDEDTGTVVTSANVPWLSGMALREHLFAEMGVPAALMHDGRAAAEAESVLGAGRDYPEAFVLTLGTGVGGGFVRGGRARRGWHGAAGEAGHITQDPHGLPCRCGGRGCLETMIGGPHISARWRELTGQEAEAREVAEAARGGDARAKAIFDQATDALARSILGIVALLDPAVVILGGGLPRSADLVVEPTVAKVAAGATFHHVPPILRAELGRWAGAWGAVLAAQRAADADR
jgi:glucokinase